MTAFDRAASDAFAGLFERFGPPEILETRRAVGAAVAARRSPDSFAEPADKHGRAALRVTLRRPQALGRGGAAFQAWREAFDRLDRQGEPDEDGQPSHEPATA